MFVNGDVKKPRYYCIKELVLNMKNTLDKNLAKEKYLRKKYVLKKRLNVIIIQS